MKRACLLVLHRAEDVAELGVEAGADNEAARDAAAHQRAHEHDARAVRDR